MDPSGAVRPAVPRTTVQATFPDGRVFEAPVGTAVGEVIRAARLAEADGGVRRRGANGRAAGHAVPDVAALVAGRLRELGTPLTCDAEVRPISAADIDGVRIYRRSLTFLLITAAGEVFPEAAISVEHSATTAGGYYCEVRNRPPFSVQELEQIEARMREIVEADAPIEKAKIPLAEAVEIYRSRGEEDKVRLLAHRAKPMLTMYRLRHRQDYLQGYMVTSAGCLRYFALHAFPPGFMLQFPHQGQPTVLSPITKYPKLFRVYEEAGDLLDRLGIRSAGALNDAIAAGRLPEISLVAEAVHEAKLAQIAAQITSTRKQVVLVFVAGPSASGKTTFAKRLAVQLLAKGRRPLAIELDNYFVDREHTPRDASGQPDYEGLKAVDVGLFNENLLALMDGRLVQLPRYSFTTGRREAGPMVQIDRQHIIIIEGIHGLNPALVPAVPADWVYRVYVSALTQLNLDRHNRVSTTDSRLVRRVVRDASTRGYTASQTLNRWNAVMRGEKQHIFPFQEHSDAIFNSALVHELAVLRPLAEPLLLQVRPEEPEYVEANRLLSFLQWFRPGARDPVPDNSILCEFIGGSVLDSLRLWPAAPEA